VIGGVARWGAGLAAATVLLLAACGDDNGDKDPNGKGSKTELDGGEAGTDRGSTTLPGSAGSPSQDGGTTGGATQGNQIAPGDSTQQTSQSNGGG
jgi:hypothetical protein